MKNILRIGELVRVRQDTFDASTQLTLDEPFVLVAYDPTDGLAIILPEHKGYLTPMIQALCRARRDDHPAFDECYIVGAEYLVKAV